MPAHRALLVFRLWAAVILAVIGIQALAPVPSPLQRGSGSAFSAATADVALASVRRGDSAKVKAIPTPTLPEPLQQLHVVPAAFVFAAADYLRPRVRGPPPRDRAERLPDLRGPPLA